MKGSTLRRVTRIILLIAATAAVAAADTGYTLWAGVVGRYVKQGLLEYDSLALDPAPLRATISWIAIALPPASTDQDRIAFHINAYNACTVDLILRFEDSKDGRLRSIREIGGAWSRYRWDVEGSKRTLDEIEHDILRRGFKEPRIHFALVCASRSCPALRSTPYRGEWLDAQLDSAASEFVLDPTRNEFTPRDGRIRISRIFDWYGKDFVGVYRDSVLERLYGRENGAVLACATRYLPPETAAALRARPVKIEYLPYDWSLNAPR